MEISISKRSWIFLWICLIFLNLIMRIPITPHEIGHDSFLVHFIADSLSKYGYAKWWLHPLSIVGLYPFSMGGALVFYFSGISQSLSLEMEQTILVSLVILGTLSLFTAYLMAGAIYDDKIFKFITALIYSTSPGILGYTTWNATGRGLFLVFLPLLIYFLIKSRSSNLKYALFTIILLIILLATHNLIFFLIPVILGYIIAIIINKIQFKASNFFGGFILLFLFIYFYIALSVEEVTIQKLFFAYARNIGIVGIFAIGGFFSILFKKIKTFEETFLILSLLLFTPLINVTMYARFFMLPFEALLISYGILNIIKVSQNRKFALFIMAAILILSICISEYYQFGRTNIEEQSGSSQFWAEESTVNAAFWVKSHVNKIAYTDDSLLSRRILAYSNVTMLSESNIIYPIQDNLVSFNVSMRSPFSTVFYSEGPFHAENITGFNVWAWFKLRDEGLDSKWGYLVEDYNIKYYIQNKKVNTVFSTSSKLKENDMIFDNGNVGIWDLENLYDSDQAS